MAGRLRRTSKIIWLAGLGLFGVLQLVPYGRDHTNPAVVREPAWDSPSTRALAVRACFDCHSNETRWPWYSHVAPVSWLVQRDVDMGRRVVNFSEWDRAYEEAGESAETVLEGEMPPAMFLWLHPSARLSAEEKRKLVRGLSTTLGSRHSFLWSEGVGAVVLAPLEVHDISDVYGVSADGSVATGSSFRLGAADEVEDLTAVYWRADGVPHRIADELAAEGVDLGGGALGPAQAAQAPLGFVGFGSKDEVSTLLGWRARLP